MSEDNGFVDLNKEATKRDQEPGGGKGLLVGLIIAVIMLIAIVVVAIMLLSKSGVLNIEFGKKQENEQKPAVEVVDNSEKPKDTEKKPDPTATPTAMPDPVDAQHCNDLEAAILESGINNMPGTKAFVNASEKYEGLVIETEDYEIVVTNGYTLYGTEPYCTVYLKYNGHTALYHWDYCLDGDNIKNFIPVKGQFIGNGREQLAFTFYKDDEKTGKILHVVSADDLSEYYVINPAKSFKSVIEIDEFWDAGIASIARIVANDRAYYVSLPHLSEEAAMEKYKLELDIRTDYNIDVDKITMKSMVALSDAGFIGEIRSDVTFTSRDMFQCSSNTFYLYSTDDFNDKYHVGIIEPITLERALRSRITVSGSNGEKLLAELQSNVPLTDKDPHNYAYDEKTGLKGYYEDGVNKAMFGVDVSRWNEDIDWKKAADAGVEFAIIRAAYRGTAAEGNLYTDTYFEKNIKGTIENGVKAGAYFFSQAITVEEAIEEANYIIKVLEPYKDKITFPVAFDTEKADNARANDLSCEERTAVARAFCDTIKNAGYIPMIYFSTNWSVMNLNLEDLADIDIWYAFYSDNIYYPYDYKIWQYQSDGALPGFNGHVDMNVGFKDYSKK